MLELWLWSIKNEVWFHSLKKKKLDAVQHWQQWVCFTASTLRTTVRLDEVMMAVFWWMVGTNTKSSITV